MAISITVGLLVRAHRLHKLVERRRVAGLRGVLELAHGQMSLAIIDALTKNTTALRLAPST